MSGESRLANPYIVPLAIARIAPDDHRERLVEAMRQNAAAMAEATAEWRHWHHQRGSGALIRRREACGPCFPPALRKRMYARAREAAPDLSALIVATTLKWFCRTTTERTSSKFSSKMWRAILAGWENQPCYTQLPLRVYCQSARLQDAERTEGHRYQHVELVAKILRGPVGLVETTFRIEHPRAGANADYQNWFAILVEMVRGKRKFSESQIVYERGRFGLRLTVDREFRDVRLDPAKLLFLRAGTRCAWQARSGGRTIQFGIEKLAGVRAARGKHVDQRRRGYATRHWQRFCRTFNRQTVAELRDTILAHGVGKVVIFDGRPRCALASVGAESVWEPTNFPIAQFRQFLTKSLQPYGCDVVGRANFKSVKRRKSRLKTNLATGLV